MCSVLCGMVYSAALSDSCDSYKPLVDSCMLPGNLAQCPSHPRATAQAHLPSGSCQDPKRMACLPGMWVATALAGGPILISLNLVGTWQVRAETARKQSAAVRIQAQWRGFAMQRQYQKLQQAAVLLQAEIRRWQAVNSYQQLKAAALIFQVCALGQFKSLLETGAASPPNH